MLRAAMWRTSATSVDRRQPRLIVLGVFAVGVALRVCALVTYRPSIVTNLAHDGAGYIRAAQRGFAWGADEPSGYPLFLRGMHVLSHHLWVTIAVQHRSGSRPGGCCCSPRAGWARRRCGPWCPPRPFG